ncbi:phosphoribosyl-ATP pyrophosphohydrolase [Moraxella sp. ZJ142]|uniref:phosphoribosyl-ATP pyrophosphohydrolase n=1 Tax=Moraxella marmotae TaxID=3344520 RepID=UPI0035D4BCDB
MIKQIKRWFETAKPNPTDADRLVQMGCHFEEVYEMTQALQPDDGIAELMDIAEEFKSIDTETSGDAVKEFFNNVNEVELLDALCDQIVTAVGVAHMMGFDIESALAEVNRSNWSKFENGKPVFDNNGKIKKGADYEPPKLQKLVGVMGDEVC